jgi:hypothetical protein
MWESDLSSGVTALGTRQAFNFQTVGQLRESASSDGVIKHLFSALKTMHLTFGIAAPLRDMIGCL